jgi:hypothetical protein
MPPGDTSGDGTSGHSAGTHAVKAVLLVGIAVLIGVIVLHRNAAGPVTVAAVSSTTTRFAPTTTTPSPATSAPGAPSSTSATTAAARPPSSVKVLVANGTDIAGLAGRVATKLRVAGYDTLASTNASVKVQATSVYYAPGYQADAEAVATAIGAPPGAVKAIPAQLPVGSLSGANVLVIAGPDISAPAGSTTTTTGASTTTTKVATTTTRA